MATHSMADLIRIRIGSANRVGDNRKTNRFDLKLPGSMVVNGKEYSVTYLDVSLGGAHVIAHNRVRPETDAHVELKLRIGASVYQDQYRVVATKTSFQGTEILLALRKGEGESPETTE